MMRWRMSARSRLAARHADWCGGCVRRADMRSHRGRRGTRLADPRREIVGAPRFGRSSCSGARGTASAACRPSSDPRSWRATVMVELEAICLLGNVAVECWDVLLDRSIDHERTVRAEWARRACWEPPVLVLVPEQKFARADRPPSSGGGHEPEILDQLLEPLERAPPRERRPLVHAAADRVVVHPLYRRLEQPRRSRNALGATPCRSRWWTAPRGVRRGPCRTAPPFAPVTAAAPPAGREAWA